MPLQEKQVQGELSALAGLQELFDRMVSSHVHSRKAGSVLAAADAVSQLSEAYDYYTAHRAVAH